MDLDGDGTRDVITGSWPGELYLFKGAKDEKGACTYAEPVKIQDKEGKDINTGSASAVYASDWDRDGDLDLVVGSIDGWVWYVPNESGDKTLKFAAAEKLIAGEKAIHEHHSAPAIADWDGNGTLDLVLGNGDGNVLWYSNAARAGKPALGESKTLHKYAGSAMADGSTCGKRVKIHVVDWNGDGRLDILAGDFGMQKPEPKELTDEQKTELEGYQEEQREISKKMQPAFAKLVKAALEEIGVEVPEDDDPMAMSEIFKGLTTEQREAYGKNVTAAMKENAEIQALQDRMRALMKLMAPLQSRATPIGNVWVLLRKAPETPVTSPGSHD